MYLFVNNAGTLSLLSPNFAGNVAADQTDILLEGALQ